jgi:DDE superfamily endonuclease
VTNKTEGTAASVSIYEFDRICKEVDRELAAEFAGVFAQKRTYDKAAAYVAALGDPAVPVKSCWGMAEGAGNETPGQFQSLIGENRWAPEKMWDGIAAIAARSIGKNPGGDQLGPGVVTDETADEKRGKHTAGVSRQYAGCAGGIVNCVTWVMMSLIGAHGKTWVSARVFLPEKTWFTGDGETGAARREKAGIPVRTAFASKPELARLQYEHLRELGTPFFWAAGDEVYGRYGKLLEDHEKNGEAYAYFIPRNYVVRTSKGERKKVDELLDRADGRYELRSAGPGVNGPRYYEWAMLALESRNRFLLIRKPEATGPGAERETGGEGTGKKSAAAGGETPAASAGKPGNAKYGDRVKDEFITFCICYVPDDSPIKPTMTNMVTMAGKRWGVEETMATAKGPIGWDESQFRQWESTQHHTALAGVAMLRANLIRERLSELPAASRTAGEDDGSDWAETAEAAPAENRKSSWKAGELDLQIPLGDSMIPYSADQERPDKIGFISLSVNEILRLVSIVSAKMSEARMAFHIAWSKWRRKHQAIARWYRMQHRMKADQKTLANPALTRAVTLCNRGSRRLAVQVRARHPLTQPINYAPRERNCSVSGRLAASQLFPRLSGWDLIGP